MVRSSVVLDKSKTTIFKISCQDKAVLGTYKELEESGIDFTSLLKERQKEEEKDDDDDDTSGIRKRSKRASVSSTVSVESEVIYTNHNIILT